MHQLSGAGELWLTFPPTSFEVLDLAVTVVQRIKKKNLRLVWEENEEGNGQIRLKLYTCIELRFS